MQWCSVVCSCLGIARRMRSQDGQAAPNQKDYEEEVEPVRQPHPQRKAKVAQTAQVVSVHGLRLRVGRAIVDRGGEPTIKDGSAGAVGLATAGGMPCARSHHQIAEANSMPSAFWSRNGIDWDGLSPRRHV